MTTPSGPLPYAEYFQGIGDVVAYAIDWSGFLSIKWRARADIAAGTTIRVGNGFAFTSDLGGFSGSIPPTWPQSLGALITEGSVQWRCVAIDDTSLTATLSNAVWTPPVGITVDAHAIALGQLATVVLDSNAATVGSDYLVLCKASFDDGESKTGEILLKIR